MEATKERSPVIQQIADDYYPGRDRSDRVSPGLPQYREAQIAMIRHYFPGMSPENQERAISTVARLTENMYQPLI